MCYDYEMSMLSSLNLRLLAFLPDAEIAWMCWQFVWHASVSLVIYVAAESLYPFSLTLPPILWHSYILGIIVGSLSIIKRCSLKSSYPKKFRNVQSLELYHGYYYYCMLKASHTFVFHDMFKWSQSSVKKVHLGLLFGK